MYQFMAGGHYYTLEIATNQSEKLTDQVIEISDKLIKSCQFAKPQYLK